MDTIFSKGKVDHQVKPNTEWSGIGLIIIAANVASTDVVASQCMKYQVQPDYVFSCSGGIPSPPA